MFAPSAVVTLRLHRLAPAEALARFGGSVSPPLSGRVLTGPHVLAVTAEHDGRPLGVALGQVLPDGVGEVLRVAVAPAARRGGVGRTLLRVLGEALAREGCTAVQATVRSDWRGADAGLALLAAAGWGAPVVQKQYYRIGRAFAEPSALIRAQPPPGYTVGDWSSLQEVERVAVEALLAADPAAAPVSPFQTPAATSGAFSVWLRHAGAVVGWMLVLQPDPRVVEYAGLYVAPEHRRGRTWLATVGGAVQRHYAAVRAEDAAAGRGVPRRVPESGLFAVEPGASAMRAIAEAAFAGHGVAQTTAWIVGTRLAPG